MNPLTNVKNLNKLNQRELELGLTAKKSWHDKYKDSAWIFVGGLPYDLTEGDILCIFSQYGEIVNINLVRDQKTGKQKGFCFLCYEDQRSTILAVDNFNGAKVLGRVMRVDHVEEYRKPKDHGDEDDLTKKIRTEGCAPRIASSPEPEEDLLPLKKKKDKKTKKDKKEKKQKKKKKEKQQSLSDESSDSGENEQVKKKQKLNKDSEESIRVKKEKYDSGYDKALRGDVPGTRQQFSDSDSDQDGHVKYSRNDRNSASRNLEFSNRDRARDRIDYRERVTDNSYSDRQRDDVSYSRQREGNDRYRESDYRSRDADSRRNYDSRGQRSNRDDERSKWDQDTGRDRGRDYDRGQGERSNRGQIRDYDRRGDRYNERNDRNSARDKYREERRNERSSSLDRRGNRDRSYDRNGDSDRRQ